MSGIVHPDSEIKIEDETDWESDADAIDPEEAIKLTRGKLVEHFIRMNGSHQKLPMKDFVKRVERELIEHALLVSFWNQRKASILLGIKPTCLNEKIKKHGIRKLGPGETFISVHKLQEMVRLLSE